MTIPLNSNGYRRRELCKRVRAEETHRALCDMPVDKKLKTTPGDTTTNAPNGDAYNPSTSNEVLIDGHVHRVETAPTPLCAFKVNLPRCLWVADITYVVTWTGFAYVTFITDVFNREIVGWNVASTLKADVLPLQALEMADWQADGDLAGVTHHADHGSTIYRSFTPTRCVNWVRSPQQGLSVIATAMRSLRRSMVCTKRS